MARSDREKLRWGVSVAVAGVAHLMALAGALQASETQDGSVEADSSVSVEVVRDPLAEQPVVSKDDAAPKARAAGRPPAAKTSSRTRPSRAVGVVDEGMSERVTRAAPLPHLPSAPGAARRAGKDESTGSDHEGGGSNRNGARGAVGPGSRTGSHRHAGRQAKLLASADPCPGLFPHSATHDVGTVTMQLHVNATGEASGPRVLDEKPAGQGFANAARACANRLHFWPATAASGEPVSATAVVRLRFARH